MVQVEPDDLTSVKAAIDNGGGVMGSSRTPLGSIFEWMNASVVDVAPSQILDDVLDDYDILVIPGGSESTCSNGLESEGKQRVRDIIDVMWISFLTVS